ncbi:amidohydrolase family protein [Algibacter amylolyticus]|uniref:Amidohydrolase family protein n=1 Tax=Algibacter amylolyticus TaxID=1608400 RepID=A0A5M7AXA1_9FLAO|nr:amidohydrolase family protein [Algibacter amylolyticus]KAA5821889.1 amidohydrolase family protein [Algibacter amylolyticus]MBB5269313.1 L-fuconolactonase [Algibacter amylolyticus]TSJ73173.1 amidohydrolase family protein [Algibacter amylolyticus]
MIIDSHQHFWIYDAVRDSWIDETMSVIRKDFLPKDLKPILDANHVEGCIAVQADQSEKETEFLLQCAEQNPFIKGVVGWVDLCDDNVEARLSHFSKNKNLKGIRHIVQAEKDDFVLGEDFQRGISKLSTFNLVYDILVFPSQLENAIKLVEKFPDQKFVLDHIAKPQISEGLNEKWVKNIKQLAAYKNVACKISGMVTETENFNWTPDQFTPFLDSIVNAFGTDRIMFGSDWPVCLLAGEYKSVLQLIENYFIDFSNEDKKLIMGRNAIKYYNL